MIECVTPRVRGERRLRVGVQLSPAERVELETVAGGDPSGWVRRVVLEELAQPRPLVLPTPARVRAGVRGWRLWLLLTPAEVERLDLVRGECPRQEWVRGVLAGRAALSERMGGSATVADPKRPAKKV